MLLINFSYNQQNWKDFVNTNNEWLNCTAIDFALSMEKNAFKNVYYPSKFDEGNHIHKQALFNYVKDMGVLSRTNGNIGNIRSFHIESLPVYWLTSISEKHPQNCVLKNLYYFMFLWGKINIKCIKIALILPEYGLHFQYTITSFLVSNGYKKINIFFNEKIKPVKNLKYCLSLFKSHYKSANKTRKVLSKIKIEDKNLAKNIIVTNIPQTWKETYNGDYVLKEIENLIKEKGQTVKYLPYFLNQKDIVNFKNLSLFDQTIFDCYPTKAQFLKLYFNLVYQLLKIKKSNFTINGITIVDNFALKHELNQVITNKLDYLINYIWFINYLKKSPISTLFYQDEFYVSGRIVSAALNKVGKKINSIGVQHGIFYDAHTVYSITENELCPIKTEDSLPIPSHFIVWGDFFKKHFLSYNKIDESFIINAGNLKYINMKASLKNNHVPKSIKNKINLLWCTTLKVDVINQFNLIKNSIEKNSNINLIIRCHPQVPLEVFISNSLLTGKYASTITFTKENSVFSDLEKCDIVLCSSGSTIFLDAMVAEKSIFHFVNDDYFMGDLGKGYMQEIKSQEDFEKAIQMYSGKENIHKDYSFILNTNQEQWNKLIAISKN